MAQQLQRSASRATEPPGVPGAAEAGDLFGNEPAYGDFDGDGRADLALGADFAD
ncbi:hypothetical protein GCM10018785_50670 [Streptomyces longispororuber]|uniref:Uncharacterized protein n=1 Tax=Streptomyces longispororuber TaxID=68230 RepID=A0A919DSK6_9ACTN|nr:FG-GAP repeat protein [Streptomyces longispororuber]GHE76266.1 hypothetical protein GCM10018785_50670 [Streptomyces longispororuber]